MVEGLFVGLLMFCLDTGSCQADEQVLLINATANHCGEECTVCTNKTIAFHQPRLYIHFSDVVSTSAPLVRCDQSEICDDGVYYWDLSGKRICFNVGTGKAAQEPGRGIGDVDPTVTNTSARAFDWIPSVRRFHKDFELIPDLAPGDRKPVVAVVDLGPGNLHAERLGKVDSMYSHWNPLPDSHANKDDFPRALAEAVVWRPIFNKRYFTISDCDNRNIEIILDRTRHARFIVSNLPEFCSSPGDARTITHFGAYFELAQDSIECTVPKLAEDEDPPEVSPMDFGEWLRMGQLKSVKCPMGTLANALCPPSKFP